MNPDEPLVTHEAPLRRTRSPAPSTPSSPDGEQTGQVRHPLALRYVPHEKFQCELVRGKLEPHTARHDLRKKHTMTTQKLFTSESINKGGRSGTIRTPDGKPITPLGNPFEKGGENSDPSPELLFAGAYSACFHGALMNAAKAAATTLNDSTVRVLVSLLEDAAGAYSLEVEIHARMPGVSRSQAQALIEAAHRTCPYSKAMRGESPVTLTVDL